MRSYKRFYKSLTNPFIRHKNGIRFINICDKVLTLFFYILYPCLLILLLLQKNKDVLKAFLIPAVSFVIVTIVRRAVNRPRPYEAEDITPLIHKDTKGKSWPSRHLFSASVIAMTVLYFNRPAGIILLVLAAFSAVIRVIGGVHYPLDTVCGYLFGVLAGVLMRVL